MSDLVGKRYGYLVVTDSQKKRTKSGNYLLACLCDCGSISYTEKSNLEKGLIKSCGCKRTENVTTHGLSKTRLYGVFNKMKSRCYKKTNQDYKYYGALGVFICDEWLSDFKSFYDWCFLNGYKEGLTIDRINVYGGYEPSNCRFITMAEQQRNKRPVVWRHGTAAGYTNHKCKCDECRAWNTKMAKIYRNKNV